MRVILVKKSILFGYLGGGSKPPNLPKQPNTSTITPHYMPPPSHGVFVNKNWREKTKYSLVTFIGLIVILGQRIGVWLTLFLSLYSLFIVFVSMGNLWLSLYGCWFIVGSLLVSFASIPPLLL